MKSASTDFSTKLLLCGFVLAVWGWVEVSLAPVQDELRTQSQPIALGLRIPVVTAPSTNMARLVSTAPVISAPSFTAR
ncbi:MAG: hypothetical protein KDE14_05780 [Rhodobacteraceae bacterium]|nr:hypothetical protein [Paracoccaceae bacterium]